MKKNSLAGKYNICGPHGRNYPIGDTPAPWPHRVQAAAAVPNADRKVFPHVKRKISGAAIKAESAVLLEQPAGSVLTSDDRQQPPEDCDPKKQTPR
jgi:hypothetical protein